MMKNWKKTIVYISLLAVLFITSCGSNSSDEDTFEDKLLGIWVSNDTTVYSGQLEINIESITITGFEESQGSYPRNEHPFRDFTKGVTLVGYSKEGKFYINDRGLLQEGIPYTLYTDYLENDYLSLTFGGRQEKMRKQEGWVYN
jgi:hypothetical protein